MVITRDFIKKLKEHMEITKTYNSKVEYFDNVVKVLRLRKAFSNRLGEVAGICGILTKNEVDHILSTRGLSGLLDVLEIKIIDERKETFLLAKFLLENKDIIESLKKTIAYIETL